MLIWIFGDVKVNQVKTIEDHFAEGYLELATARVNWFLSIDEEHLPDPVKTAGKRTYRSLTIAEEEVEFSDGFTDLHTLSYQQILQGKGCRISDAKPSIELVHNLRK